MQGKSLEMPDDFLRKMADVIKVLGNGQRLKIAQILEIHGETGAGRISELCEISQAITSQHLTQMRRTGLVESRREGNQVFYRLEGEHAKTIITCLRKKYMEMQGVSKKKVM